MKETHSKVMNRLIPLMDRLHPHRYTVLLPIVLILFSSFLYFSSLKYMDIGELTDIGLISILPVPVFIAMIVLCGSYLYVSLQSDIKPFLLFLHLVVLILILFGTTIWLEESPRFNVTWRHVGIVKYIAEQQSLGPGWDVYFGWPGFFIVNAFLVNLAGLASPISYVSWSPVILNLLYLGPLLLIFRSATSNQRLIWTAVFFFYLTNWIGQDYFSAQGFAYFFYLLIIGILLFWFRQAEKLGWLEKITERIPFLSGLGVEAQQDQMVQQPDTTPIQRVSLFLILLLLLFYVAVSHQLTPFALFLSIAALTLFKRIKLNGLVFIVLVLTMGVVGFMGIEFIGTNIEKLIAGVGQVDAAVEENLTGRLKGSPGHLFVVQLRLVMTLVLWGLAGLGILMRIRKGIWDLNMLLITAAPFLLGGLQLYGGEMLLRIYLFTIPSMAFFAASLFYPEKFKLPKWILPSLLGLTTLVMLFGFLYARYGNEKFDQFTKLEVAGVEALYNLAESRELIVAPSPHYPVKFQDYTDHPQLFVDDEVISGDIEKLAEAIRNRDKRGGYFIITTSQLNYFKINYNFDLKNWVELENNLQKSNEFKLVYKNDDARIYHYAPEN